MEANVIGSGEAKVQAIAILTDEELVSPSALSALIRAAEKGQIVGRNKDTCFIGILARATGRSYRQFKLAAGIPMDWEKNPVELFVHSICSGHTPDKSAECAHLVMWCDEAARRRAGTSAGVIISTEPTEFHPIGTDSRGNKIGYEIPLAVH